MTRLYLFVRFLALLQSLIFSAGTARADPKVDQCLALGTISQIARCLDPLSVPTDTWTTDEQFALAQLSPKEFGDYLGVVHDALNATEYGVPCTSQISPYTLPESLRNFVTLRQVGDLCVLAESTVFNGTRFEKGLPLIALRSRLTSSRPLHISATQLGLGVFSQAAAVFEHAGARSYIATTRSRAAYTKQGCGKLSTGEPIVDGWVTDAAYHDQEVFHQVALVLNAWQEAHGGCPNATCAYIQLRSMTETVCPNDTVFISAGIAPATWYASTSLAAQRVNRFTQALRTVTSGLGLNWTVNTPETSNCIVTETTNLLGRVLNGVQRGQECDHTATTALASGSFLLVEQRGVARQAANDQVIWARAVREAFAPTCKSGYKLDGDGVGCAPVSP